MTDRPPPPPPPPPGYGNQPPYQQPPPAKRRGGCGKTLLVALGVVAILIVAIVAIAVAGGDDDDVARDTNGNGNGELDTRSLDLYPERADRQDNDHEAELGQSVRLAGYTAAVDEAAIDDDGLGGTNLVISVAVENRDDDAQPYNTFDWRIQTDDGQVLDPTINVRDDDLGSGDLVSGGTTTGTVAFDGGPGTYYVIYKPDAFSSHRGIWRIEV
jgi:hypothetical protein